MFARPRPKKSVLAPPPNETPAEREARLLAEAEAKRISDAIDEELHQQRQAERKGPRPIKILLLGECSVPPQVVLRVV